MSAAEEFDELAESYEATLDEGLAVTGEGSHYFARGRIAWLRRSLRPAGPPAVVMDYGCGTGSATPYLLDVLQAGRVVGVDVSARSIQTAARAWASTRASFSVLAVDPPEAVDLVFCNGVFHHIPPGCRADAVRYVHRALRPGGLFAFWENNPWNPGTQLVMRRLPFDRDAVTIAAPEARRLLREGGFDVISRTFLFVFPSALKWCRGLEPALSGLPLGGQYQLLARKAA
jgi:SAM-dependent methyltransferase